MTLGRKRVYILASFSEAARSAAPPAEWHDACWYYCYYYYYYSLLLITIISTRCELAITLQKYSTCRMEYAIFGF